MAKGYVAQLLPDQEQADLLTELLAGVIIKDGESRERVAAAADLLSSLTKQTRTKAPEGWPKRA